MKSLARILRMFARGNNLTRLLKPANPVLGAEDENRPITFPRENSFFLSTRLWQKHRRSYQKARLLRDNFSMSDAHRRGQLKDEFLCFGSRARSCYKVRGGR